MKKIVIVGANDNCINVINNELNLESTDIVCFLDNNKEIQGKKVFGKKIDSFENINDYKFDFILILSSINNHKDIEEKLLKLGVEKEKIIRHYSLPKYIKELNLRSYVWRNLVNDKIDNLNIDKLIDLNISKQYKVDLLKEISIMIKYSYDHKKYIDKIFNDLNKYNKVDIKGIKIDKKVVESINKNLFYFEFIDILAPYLIEDNKFFIEGPYEYKNICINDNDIIIDCGANIGLFTRVAATKSYNGKVYSFEPVENTYNILKDVKLEYDNVEVIKKGISNLNDIIEIDTSDYQNQSASCTIVKQLKEKKQSKLLNKTSEQIEVVKLDDFIKENKIQKVDFIKADIEGAERYLLEGAKETLRNFAPKLSICTYHLPDDPEVLEKLILEANPEYIVEHKWSKLYAYVPYK